MKVIILLIILFGCNCVQAQENAADLEIPIRHQFDKEINLSLADQAEDRDSLFAHNAEEEFEKLEKSVVFFTDKSKRKKNNLAFLKTEIEEKSDEAEIEEIDFDKKVFNKYLDKNDFNKKKSDDSAGKIEEKFHWKPAMIQSGLFLGIQHGFRLFQRKTQRELDGKFFRDWGNSVKNLRGWADGDNLFINYVGHPMQGAATGRIFINNSDKSKKLEFGSSKDYWTSRMKAMAWSAVWSTQFELGPISEATIGNVGVYDNYGRSSMAWVDMVMTPTAGTGVLIGEDMIDKYILKNWLEKKLKSRTRIKVYRTFLNPITSFVNVLGGKQPWKRYNR